MKYAFAVLLAPLFASSALAAETCDYGKPDVFKFVKWEFRQADAQWMEIKLTFHNTLNYAISSANIRVVVDDKHFLIRSRELINASSDGVAIDQLGIPLEDAARFQILTPALCVESVKDQNGESKSLD